MLHSLRLVLALVVLLPMTLRAQTTVSGTIRFGGVVRDYRLYVPQAYASSTATVPLLFNLHGYGSNKEEQELYGDFRAIADTANFLVVHPNGTLDPAGNRYWNTFTPPGTGGPDDVAFLSALIDSLRLRYRIDANRVYSTGMSNGGFMSYELACQLSNRVAAIASVAGSMTTSRLAVCNATRPVPVLEIHGTADNTVPYTGNILFVPIPTLVAAWVQRNGCNPTPTLTQVPDLTATDGSTAERQVYSGSQPGSVVEHYRIIGGGHTWPGAPVDIGVTNRDIHASREIWRFLRPYRLNQLTPLPTRTAATAVGLRLVPNPATRWVQVQSAQPIRPGSVRVYDTTGRQVAIQPQVTGATSVQLNTAGWPAGVYLVEVETGEQLVHQRLLKQME
ncbi:T9SS type A sorting domain-containing protein [Hymenobacter sp. HSC-4F20]|uniref:extracellular catalytic domain type 1 short-chain-length polyhydroxyalkanoate depolymerase n=1 Tax=Hymenobacter sp. HSC-4F20 TaxID=2864135 RepID=UPI001C73CEDC|nr:PHB depolymerase family esterase [Hymenobacter sp. HSC-4F20]MBX0292362.1 T9SS type A sorting domain-containing protein [Hymenobacter sp. HSC-4F20]